MNDHPVRVEEALKPWIREILRGITGDYVGGVHGSDVAYDQLCNLLDKALAARPHPIEAQGSEGENGNELADYIRDQVCCPRIHGCDLGGAKECPAERVRRALTRPDPSLGGREAVFARVIAPIEADEDFTWAEWGMSLRRFAMSQPAPPSLGMEGVRSALELAAWRFEYLARQFRKDGNELLVALAPSAEEAAQDARQALASISPSGKGEG
jgi:hypothetical protein